MGPVFHLYTASLLFAFKVVSTCPDGHCRELVFPQFFFFAHKRLVNHNIETLQVNDFDMCRLRCYQEPNCVSINFNLSRDSEGLHNCELNNATHQRHDNELKDKADYYYRGALNACDEAHCKNGGTCLSGFTDKGYCCVCPLGFTSAHCEQGCPKDWVLHDKYCYKLTNSRNKRLVDARRKCREMLADLPIIKSEQENTFIVSLMSDQKRDWVRLGMRRNDGQLLWFDGISAERSNTSRYHAWGSTEPSNGTNENCAYLDSGKKWNDNKCDYNSWNNAPFVLCQKAPL